MENALQEDISNLIERLRNVATDAKRPVELTDIFYITAINQLWTVLFGQEILADEILHIEETISSLSE